MSRLPDIYLEKCLGSRFGADGHGWDLVDGCLQVHWMDNQLMADKTLEMIVCNCKRGKCMENVNVCSCKFYVQKFVNVEVRVSTKWK